MVMAWRLEYLCGYRLDHCNGNRCLRKMAYADPMESWNFVRDCNGACCCTWKVSERGRRARGSENFKMEGKKTG